MCYSSFSHSKKEPNGEIGLKYSSISKGGSISNKGAVDNKTGLRFSNVSAGDVSKKFTDVGNIVTDLTGLWGKAQTGITQSLTQPNLAVSPAGPFQKIWIEYGQLVATLIGKK